MKIGFILFSIFHCSFSRIIFPPGSDVGYILSDDDNEVNRDPKFLYSYEGGEDKEITDFIKNNIAERSLPNVPFPHDYETWKSLDGSYGSDSAVSYMVDVPNELKDKDHGVVMGVPYTKCDDGMTMLDVDWDMSPVNYTCFTPKNRFKVNSGLEPLVHCDEIPKSYKAQHYCMGKKITYSTPLPTYGPHRPIWPIYGEYKFLPPQRWLHSLEHGAIVMFYHPCAESILVKQLKDLVKSCIRKHIISANSLLSDDRPLELRSWGCTFSMSTVDSSLVLDFIRNHALKSPEGRLAKEGIYNLTLIQQAEVPKGSNYKDDHLCPE